MIPIVVIGILLVCVILYAVIDGTIFEPDEVESKTIRVEDEWKNENVSDGTYDCP